MTQSKALQPVVPMVEPPAAPAEPAPPPEPKRRARRAPPARKAKEAESLQPRELGTVLDDALARMERRAAGTEKPIPLPWPTLATALGGGFWGGTAVTLVGDTGCGKTQWALQVAAHAAGNRVPVCYVASEPGVDQVASRLLALKAGQKWNDLYVGNTDSGTIDTLRSTFSDELKALPFHLLPGVPSRPGEPTSRSVAEWMRQRYPETRPGERPLLIVQDFVELVTGAGRDQDDYNELMGRVAREARLTARELGVVVLLVSSTSREQRLSEDESIGIHHERRQPRGLGRGNPARLLLTGKNTGDMERESDTVLVLARGADLRPSTTGGWTRVWCAVAKNRAGGRAWVALRFNGSTFEEDTEASTVVPMDAELEVPAEE